MKIYFIERYHSFHRLNIDFYELRNFHGFKKPALGNEIMHTNFYGEDKKSPGAMIKNTFEIEDIFCPSYFVVNQNVLDKISSLNFDKMEIDFLVPYHADKEQQEFIRAYFKKRGFDENDFVTFMKRYEDKKFNEKYYEIYFPHIKAIQPKYTNLKKYLFNLDPEGNIKEENIELSSAMFNDFDAIIYMGTYFTEKAFNIFWPLLNEKYFYYKVFEIE